MHQRLDDGCWVSVSIQHDGQHRWRARSPRTCVQAASSAGSSDVVARRIADRQQCGRGIRVVTVTCPHRLRADVRQAARSRGGRRAAGQQREQQIQTRRWSSVRSRSRRSASFRAISIRCVSLSSPSDCSEVFGARPADATRFAVGCVEQRHHGMRAGPLPVDVQAAAVEPRRRGPRTYFLVLLAGCARASHMPARLIGLDAFAAHVRIEQTAGPQARCRE